VLSVLLRKVCVMSPRTLPRSSGGVSSLSPQVVWEVLPDHWDSLLWVSADDVSTSVVWALEGRGARVLRKDFSHLRDHAKVLWSPSYLVASVGYFSKSAARRYFHRRWDAVAAS
jgi:REP element-mobilizing transposase RayT